MAIANVVGDFPSWPSYEDDEKNAVLSTLTSGKVNYWTGELGRAFESRFASYVGARHGVAMSNGSVAIGAILRALGVGPEDEVIVTARSFIASASEIELAGARAIFADVDRDSQNITPQTVEQAISPKTKGIIAVHLAGWPCDMPALQRLAEASGLWIIEDCAQAHGSRVNDQPIGSFGAAAAFSFCQDKILSTGGEGGMVTTSDDELWSRIWSHKDHGKDPERVAERPKGPGFRWVHAHLGSNYRMTEPQAAIGLRQLEKLDRWVDLRQRNAAILNSEITNCVGIRVPQPPAFVRHAYYKFYAFLDPLALRLAWSRDRILQELVDCGIPCGSGVCPELYMEDAFIRRYGPPRDRLPVAQELGQTSLMLPVHPTLTESHMERIGDAVAKILRQAVR